MELTGKSETNSEPISEGNIGDPVVEASVLHCQQVLRVGVEATVTVNDKFDPEASLVPDEHSADLTTEIKESETSQIPKNNVVPDVILNSNIPNSNNDQVVTREEVLQVHNLNASTKFEFSPGVSGSTSNPDKCRDCHSKLDTIPEVSFTEFREEALGPVLKDMFGSDITTLVDLKGAGNTKGSSEQPEIQKDIPEAEFPGNFQNNISGVSPDCESSLERRMEASDHVMILQTSANIDEAERDPKPQDVPVKLRTRKSSREDKERERSQLDSMVLLIMKLDQLDQEIEDALGSAPSPKDTPTAKRRFVSEVDLASLDGDGSLTGSLRSLNTPHHQSSSSLCSLKNRTSAALSEKDRAGRSSQFFRVFMAA
ncbi:hypothetical protein PDJAM_G00174690 [Pangasius djambal]|uniref:Uncharacterized protein n=1 Tax=Pangasius djambal TaxID=1691987 RepID=A0ACC5ZP06_9TELE|nr:hypothetical protein [Pangasius djambal]